MGSAHEPLEQVRQVFKVDWYRCPLSKEELKALTERSDWKGAAQTLGYLAVLVVLGALAWVLFEARLWVAFGVSLFLYGTACSFGPGLVTHELSHGTVFRTKWLNSLFLRFFSLAGWINFHHYKRSHTFHHLYTLHPRGDREVVLPRPASLHPLRLLLLFTFNVYGFVLVVYGTLLLALTGKFHNDGRWKTEWSEDIFGPEATDARRKARLWAAILILFHGAVTAVAVVFKLWMLPILVTAGGYIAQFWMYFVGEPMHTGLRDNVPDFRLCVRTIKLDPVSRFLYWYMNYHTEHHMYAAVPCYNLPKLSRAIAFDMPAPRTLLGAWREMRETRRRQKVDPSYQFDTPLPKPREGLKDTLGASLGDLAPKELA